MFWRRKRDQAASGSPAPKGSEATLPRSSGLDPQIEPTSAGGPGAASGSDAATQAGASAEATGRGAPPGPAPRPPAPAGDSGTITSSREPAGAPPSQGAHTGTITSSREPPKLPPSQDAATGTISSAGEPPRAAGAAPRRDAGPDEPTSLRGRTGPTEAIARPDDVTGNAPSTSSPSRVGKRSAELRRLDLEPSTEGDISAVLAQTVIPPEGLRFGKYLLKGELGRGGMGVVYRGIDIALNRPVAVKLMLSEDVPEDEQVRFIREAESSAALRHPFIVTVHEVGKLLGRLYFSMDFVEGSTLKSVIQERAGDREFVLRLFMKVCEAIGFAHQHGIIHRDLKPQNIMVDAAGDPHVMDFGLARKIGEKEQVKEVRDRRGRLTRVGAVMGTPAYMPPEQAGGRIDEVDTRSDLYSLGVILYVILTGDLPFRARSTPELLMMIDELEAPPPSSRNPACPWELERVALKAIAKKREDRYQTAAELRADIEAFLTTRPVAAANGGTLYRAGKFVRRNRRRVAITAAVVAMLAGTGAYSVEEARRTAHEHEARAQEKLDRAAPAVAMLDREREEYRKVSSGRAPEENLVALDALVKGYDAAGLDVRDAHAIDARNPQAVDLARTIERAEGDVVAERKREQTRKADLDARKKKRDDAAALAVSATADLAAIDPAAPASKAEVVTARDGLSAAQARLGEALGLDPDCAAARQGVDDVLAKRAALDVHAREVETREERETLSRDAGSALDAAVEAGAPVAGRTRHATGPADEKAARDALSRAVSDLSRARLLAKDDLDLERLRADAGLAQCEMSLAANPPNPGAAAFALDEIQDLAHEGTRVAAARKRVKEATESAEKFDAAMKDADVALIKGDFVGPQGAAACYLRAKQAADRPEAEFGIIFSEGCADAAAKRYEKALARYADARPFAARARDAAALEAREAEARAALADATVAEAEAAKAAYRYDDASALVKRALAFAPKHPAALKLDGELKAREHVPPGCVLVLEGPFTFGTGAAAREAVSCTAFFLAKTEVTNRDFLAFVEAGGYEKRELWDKEGLEALPELVGLDGRPGPLGWRNSRPPEGEEDLPVAGISWLEARAFCAWKQDGWRLPSEVEWEKAATWDAAGARKLDPPWLARGKDGAVVSSWATLWGQYFDRARPKKGGEALARPDGQPLRGPDGQPVFDRSPCGAEDLWGNVREWTSAREGDRDVPVVRGGSFASRNEARARADSSRRPVPGYRALDVGFRLAKSVQ